MSVLCVCKLERVQSILTRKGNEFETYIIKVQFIYISFRSSFNTFTFKLSLSLQLQVQAIHYFSLPFTFIDQKDINANKDQKGNRCHKNVFPLNRRHLMPFAEI